MDKEATNRTVYRFLRHQHPHKHQHQAGSIQEATHRVRRLRRAVHDGVQPEAAREGKEAPEQSGLRRRRDERAVRRVRRAPLK